jgi:dipeptidyl-peptidase-4
MPHITTQRRIHLICEILALAFLLAPATAVSQESGLTIDRIVALPSITGTSPSAPAWSPDSGRLAFLWNDSAMPRREIWIVQGDGAGLRPLTRETEGTSGVSQFAWTPDGLALVYIRSGNLWRVEAKGGDGTRLTATGGGKSNLAISPNGRHASFLQGGDLWLLELKTNVLTQATRVGVPSISSVPLGTYNRPDVEIGPYVWGGPTYQWSPDSLTIAVHYVDRSKMRIVPFPYYLGDETLVNNHRRGYPGDPNEHRTVGFYNIESGRLNLLDLPDPTENRVVDFSWSPTGTLLIDRESDTTEERWLHKVDPASGSLEQLWHDKRDSRIYTSIGSAWHSDGKRVVFLSDRGDRYGLYLLDPEKSDPKLLTNDKFDVTGSPQVNLNAKSIFFQSNEPSPYERHVFRIPDEGGVATRISTLPGQHQLYPSPDGSQVALLHSDDVSPTELFLVVADGQSVERRITTSPPAEFAQTSWARARYVTLPSRIDDYTLHARLLEPVDLDREKRHPVVFGPVYSNTVRNRWAGRNAMLHQLLVERGYIVVQVDVRGSTGYGRAFREEFLMDFAGEDVEDLHSAVEYMATLPYVDAERIGIWGSSYGGTLSIYSLFKKPGLFKAGVAGAAAVNPYFFGTDDVAIVRRPESHPKAFARGAAQYAGNLQDHLLIIHGMQDDVVPFKTTVMLAEELMRLGKDFDFAFAPGATHSWTQKPHHARYLLGKLVAHFDRYLGAGPRIGDSEKRR